MRRHVRRVEPVTMVEEILIDTRQQHRFIYARQSYRIRYLRPNSGRQLVAYQLPKTDDPLAGITSAHFMKLAWRLATEKARELGWIV